MLVEDVELFKTLTDTLLQVVVQDLLHCRLDAIEADKLVLTGRKLAENSFSLEAVHMLLN